MIVIRVYLKCPHCDYQGLAALIRPDTWWGAATSPEAVAKMCYCPKCWAAPPMELVDAPTEEMLEDDDPSPKERIH